MSVWRQAERHLTNWVSFKKNLRYGVFPGRDAVRPSASDRDSVCGRAAIHAISEWWMTEITQILQLSWHFSQKVIFHWKTLKVISVFAGKKWINQVLCNTVVHELVSLKSSYDTTFELLSPFEWGSWCQFGNHWLLPGHIQRSTMQKFVCVYFFELLDVSPSSPQH